MRDIRNTIQNFFVYYFMKQPHCVTGRKVDSTGREANASSAVRCGRVSSGVISGYTN